MGGEAGILIAASFVYVYGLLLLQNSTKGAYLVSYLDPEVAELYLWLQVYKYTECSSLCPEGLSSGSPVTRA